MLCRRFFDNAAHVLLLLLPFSLGGVCLTFDLAAAAPAVPNGEVGDKSTPDPAREKEIARLIDDFDRHGSWDPQTVEELARYGLPAVPQVVQAIVGRQERIAAHSAHTLDEIGRPAVVLVRVEWEKLGEQDRWKLMRFRGEYDYEAALPFVLGCLDSDVVTIRRQAIRYLGEQREVRARDVLILKLYSEGWPLRWDIIQALSAIGGQEVRVEFIKLLEPDSLLATGTRADHDARQRIIKTLHEMWVTEAAPALLKVLQERGPGRAYLGSTIIPALVDFGFEPSIPELRLIVAANPSELAPAADAAEKTQALAAQAIIQLETDSSAEWKMDRLERKIRELIRVYADPEAGGKKIVNSQRAGDELVRIGRPAVPQLIEAVLYGNEYQVDAYSALDLDEIGRPAVELVRAKWEKLGEEDRWKLMRFRGRYDYEAVLDFALHSLDSEIETVRHRAILYLGKHKEVRARGALLKKLNTEGQFLRWDIVDVLTKIGGDEVMETYTGLLKPDSWVATNHRPAGCRPPPWAPDSRHWIIQALHELHAKQAAPALLSVLQEKGAGKAYMAWYIIPALTDFGYQESVPELKRIVAADPAEFAPALDNPARIKALAATAISKLEESH